MKNVFLTMAMMLLFASCAGNDDHELIQEQKMIDVSLNVNVFDVTNEPMARSTRAGTPAETVLEKIDYSLQSTTTNYFINGSQMNEPGKTFGKISIRIPEGSYKIYIWGTGKTNAEGKAEMDKYGALGDEFNIKNAINAYDKDIFHYPLQTLTIDATTPSINCELQRITSKLTIRVMDKKPVDVTRVEVSIYYKRLFKPFTTETSTKPLDMTVTKEIKAKPDGTFDDLVWYSFPDPGTKVIFYLYNETNKIIGSAEINTPTYTNRNTIVKGNLFDLIAGKDFNVTVNDIWGSDNIIDMNK